MSMYRASAYEKSQSTLLEFASKFNSSDSYPNLYCCPIIKETMLNDGCFVDVGAGKLFAFDWEIRTKLESFKPGEFRYSTLTEFERKFEKVLQNVERSAIISNVAAIITPVRRKKEWDC